MARESTYLILFDDKPDIKAQIRGVIDNSPMIGDWVYFMNGVFAVKITGTKDQLFQLLKRSLHGRLFFIAELKSDGVSGFLPGSVWDFIRGPEEKAQA